MQLDVRSITGARLAVAVDGPQDNVRQLRSRAAAVLGPDVRCRLLLRVRHLVTQMGAKAFAAISLSC
jgi:hypothetical protein